MHSFVKGGGSGGHFVSMIFEDTFENTQCEKVLQKVEDLVAIEEAAASSPDFQFGLYNNYYPRYSRLFPNISFSSVIFSVEVLSFSICFIRQERQPVLGILQVGFHNFIDHLLLWLLFPGKMASIGTEMILIKLF